MGFILAFGGLDDGVSRKRVFDLMDHADTFVLNFSKSLADKIVKFRKAHCLKLFLSYLLSKQLICENTELILFYFQNTLLTFILSQ
jgi:hypothetical protein